MSAYVQMLAELANVAEAMRAAGYEQAVERFVWRYVNTLRNGGKLLFCGNGGSAADSQHLAAEYVVKLRDVRPALAAVALTVDTSILTAIGNDFGFDNVFVRQLQALASPKDLLIVHSTSGNSPNLVNAVAWAVKAGIPTVALLGKDGGYLKDMVSEAIVVPSQQTSHIQELHLALQHYIAAQVEDRMWASG